MAVSRLFCNASHRTTTLGAAPDYILNHKLTNNISTNFNLYFKIHTFVQDISKKKSIFRVRLFFWSLGRKPCKIKSIEGLRQDKYDITLRLSYLILIKLTFLASNWSQPNGPNALTYHNILPRCCEKCFCFWSKAEPRMLSKHLQHPYRPRRSLRVWTSDCVSRHSL